MTTTFTTLIPKRRSPPGPALAEPGRVHQSTISSNSSADLAFNSPNMPAAPSSSKANDAPSGSSSAPPAKATTYRSTTVDDDDDEDLDDLDGGHYFWPC